MPNIYETLTSFVLPLIERQLLITLCARHHARSSQAPHAPPYRIQRSSHNHRSKWQRWDRQPCLWSQTLRFSCSPQGPMRWLCTGPRRVPASGIVVQSPLAIWCPSGNFPSIFNFPLFFFLPAQRGCGGGEQVGACFKVWFSIRFGPGSRVEQNATLWFQRFFFWKEKKKILWMIMKIWTVRLDLVSNKERSEMVLSVRVGREGGQWRRLLRGKNHVAASELVLFSTLFWGLQIKGENEEKSTNELLIRKCLRSLLTAWWLPANYTFRFVESLSAMINIWNMQTRIIFTHMVNVMGWFSV